MLAGLGSFGMLFGTLFFSYMLLRERTTPWPPIGVEPLQPTIPLIATILLAISSIFVHFGFRKLERGDTAGFRRDTWIGFGFGVAFIIAQSTLWSHMLGLGITLNSNIFASVVYLLTGLHVLHIVGGLAALAWVSRKAKIEGARMAGWFWHFVDVLWICMLFLLVYY